jgi:uncharacterized membrane protein
MGWCPMTSQAHYVISERENSAQQETAGTSGPVTDRALLYSRLTWVVVGLAWLIALTALPNLPEIIPVHWNIYGEADGFAERFIGAISFPVLITLTAIILIIIPRFETMRYAFVQVRDIYSIISFSTICMLLCLEIISLLSSAGTDLPIAILFPMFLGLLFIVIGSLMPHVGRNTLIGFRLPWTLHDDVVWKETHERGGSAFVSAGVLIMVASPFAGKLALPLMLSIIMIATLYIVIFSYLRAKYRAPVTVPAKDH